MTPRGQSDMRLGRVQILVLRLLASGDRPKTAATVACDWPVLDRSSVYGALDGLARRGFVDLGPGGCHRGRFVRSYILTARGAAVEAALNVDEDLDEGEDG